MILWDCLLYPYKAQFTVTLAYFQNFWVWLQRKLNFNHNEVDYFPIFINGSCCRLNIEYILEILIIEIDDIFSIRKMYYDN